MLFGGLFMLIIGLLRGEASAFHLSDRSIDALVYLALVGSILGYSAFVYALRDLPMATVSLYAYVNPVIAVALGAALLGEPVSGHTLVATCVVLAGMAIVK
jgi:drug/metabolite transporter (DMT)-like permease